MFIVVNRRIYLICCVYFLMLQGLGHFIPLVQDEAYYLDWSRHLSGGYFDHPPMVAWMAAALGRASSSLLATGGLFFFYKILHILRPATKDKFSPVPFILMLATGFIANGVLLTPDASLQFFWFASLYASLKLFEKPTLKTAAICGSVMGLGLLSKYTFVLFLPVFVYSSLWEKRISRRKFAVVVLFASLFFSINAIWNLQNNFTTIRFQLNHGFSQKQDRSQAIKMLPETPNSHESLTAKKFDKFENPGEVKIHVEKPFWQKDLERLSDYLGGVFILFGFLIFPAAYSWWTKRKLLLAKDTRFISLSAGFPFLFFLMISPFTKIEANWAGMILVGGSVLTALFSDGFLRSKIIIPAALNVLLMVLLTGSFQFGDSQYIIKRNRLLKEVSGYDELSKVLTDAPYFADTYQLTAMLKLRGMQDTVTQIPSVQRDSEFTRRLEDGEVEFADYLHKNSLFLISSDDVPPRLGGFQLFQSKQFRKCNNLKAQLVYENSLVENICRDYIKKWWILEYKAGSSKVQG